ncbi:small ribosomal subunit protein mL103 (rPPR7)-like [Tasmannia lanceolata]|uniref:small ribosomal subunit protein mL103 (rPPR7)-like n=1 Tax=Tasmannia lanceolata TaxID=3420 RepID=UPI004063A379
MALFSSSSRHRTLLHSRLFSSTTTTTSSPSPTQPNSISTAISALRSEHDPNKILALYSSFASRPISPLSSRYALDLAVKRLSKSRSFSIIETLIEAQKKTPKITQEPFLSTLILSYGRAGMIDHATRTFEEMGDLGTPRTVLSFNALLTACNKSQKFDQVPKLFSEIPQKFGISPDKISYGILVKSLCEMGSTEAAISILKEMREKEIEVTGVTYTTVLDALYKMEKVEEAEKIWNEMGENGCSPDVVAYNVRIMHAHKGTPEEVLKLMGEMISKGLKPDTISYNYLMKCYCEKDQIKDAKNVYDGLMGNGCNPNAVTYKTLVHHLCKNGDLDECLKVAHASIKSNRIPDVGTMKHLVEELAKNSKLEEAKGLIGEVKKKFPESFLTVWKKVEMELGLNIY